MILRDLSIPLATNLQTVELIPLGCIHADTETFEERLFRDALRRIELGANTYALFVGDELDLSRSAFRRHVRSFDRDQDSQKRVDAPVQVALHEFYAKYLRKIQHKIIGMALGNHHWEFSEGLNSTMELCRLTKAPYLGVASWIRLYLKHRKHDKTIKTLKIFTHHGNWSGGSGYTKGASRNLADRKGIGRAADILVFAHDHKPDVWIDEWQTIPTRGALQLETWQRVFIRAGTFMRGEREGCVTYVERSGLRPEPIGYTILRIDLHQDYNAEKSAEARRRFENDHEGRCDKIGVRYAWEVVTG